MTRLKHALLGAIISMVIPGLLHASPLQTEVSLAATCETIPNFKQALCYVKTSSPYGPFDDVVIYRRTAEGEMVLLSSHSGGVGTFGGMGFSPQGRLMWVEWAEEGHGYFNFYRTVAFLDSGEQAEAIHGFEDLEFNGFMDFTDSGMVSYYVPEVEDGVCPKGAIAINKKPGKRKPNEWVLKCYKQLQLMPDKTSSTTSYHVAR